MTNYTLKSGTNRFHGNGFWVNREDIFDACGFFVDKKRHEIQNEFGGTLGGPIIKDKTFFFGSYSGFRFATPEAEHNSSLYRPRISGVGISPD